MSLDSQISQLQTKVNNLDSKISNLSITSVGTRNDVSTLKNTVIPFQQVIENITINGGINPLSFTSQNKDSVTLAKGTPVTNDASGSGVVRADASANSKTVVGLANIDISAGVSGDVIAGGFLNLSDWSGITGSSSLVAKGKYFLSTIVGKLTNTPTTTPGNYSQLVGIAVDSQTLELKISYPILL